MSKKIPFFVVSCGLVYLFYASNGILMLPIDAFIQLCSCSGEFDFRLGRKEKIRWETNWNLIDKTYRFQLKSEFADLPQNTEISKIKEMKHPIHLKLKVFYKEPFNINKKFLFEKEFKGFEDFKSQSLEDVLDSSNPALTNRWAFSTSYAKKYFFEVEDLTHPGTHQENIKTSISFTMLNRYHK